MEIFKKSLILIFCNSYNSKNNDFPINLNEKNYSEMTKNETINNSDKMNNILTIYINYINSNN